MPQLVYFLQKKYNRAREVLSMNDVITKKAENIGVINVSIVVYQPSIKTGNMWIGLSCIKDRHMIQEQ
jgi:hypothetical protein